MTDNEQRARKYADEWYDVTGMTSEAWKEAVKEITQALSEAEKRGREETLRDNVLLNKIRNEQFELGLKRGAEREREVCAGIAENEFYITGSGGVVHTDWNKTAQYVSDKIAKAIRSRSGEGEKE